MGVPFIGSIFESGKIARNGCVYTSYVTSRAGIPTVGNLFRAAFSTVFARLTPPETLFNVSRVKRTEKQRARRITKNKNEINENRRYPRENSTYYGFFDLGDGRF